jgi:hypothetical protein
MAESVTPNVSIGAVAERDIDLLLVGEFASSPDFVRWFLKQIGAETREPIEVLYCCRSATDSTGESDVEIFLRAGDEIVAVLLEDKVHSAAQPRQAERYRERGEGYERAGRCGRFITVLVAPETYLRGNLRGFDRTVSYEELIEGLEHADSAHPRSRFKAAVFRAAIEKATKGYQVVEDRVVTQFWLRYWERSQAIAPELDMKKPGGLPASSSFVYFRPGKMPRGSYLVHKMALGFIDIQFDRMAERLPELSKRYSPPREAGMRITRAGKSGVIRVDVPKLQPTLDPEPQVETIDQCLRRATEFLAWFRRVREQPG